MMKTRRGEAPGNADLVEMLTHATRRRLRQAEPLLRAARRRVPALELRFDLRGRSAGQVVWRQGRDPCIRYNPALAAAQPEAFAAETVAHEVAHVVTYLCHGRVAPHGPEWRAVMRHFGFAEPQRCHSFDLGETAMRQQRRWRYVCDCGAHTLSTTRHNRVQAARQDYVCRHCGTTLQYRP